jgi:hypothetical protein
VRHRIARLKCDTEDWVSVHRTAHQLGMRTTATMMFGVGENFDQRINHFETVRRLQEETGGFTAFIPWSFQPGNTALGGRGWDEATSVEYLKVLAISRLYLDNIENVQASWVTQGLKVLEVGLHFGGNDVGSVMLEENVVKAAGTELHDGRRAAAHYPRCRIQARAAGHALPHDVFELVRVMTPAASPTLRTLGNSDLHITPIGFGAWAIGGGDWQYGWGAQDDDDSIAAIHRALDLGINWIDTAAVYGLGHSEEMVGRAVKSSAHKPYIFTKCSMRWHADRSIYNSQDRVACRRSGSLAAAACRLKPSTCIRSTGPIPTERD